MHGEPTVEPAVLAAVRGALRGVLARHSLQDTFGNCELCGRPAPCPDRIDAAVGHAALPSARGSESTAPSTRWVAFSDQELEGLEGPLAKSFHAVASRLRDEIATEQSDRVAVQEGPPDR